MESTDLNDIIGKPVTDIHVGRYSTWLEFEDGAELHVEPKLENADGKTGNPYATLSTRVVP